MLIHTLTTSTPNSKFINEQPLYLKVSSGNDWSNLASGLAASSRLAGRMACNLVNQVSEMILIAGWVLVTYILAFFPFLRHAWRLIC